MRTLRERGRTRPAKDAAPAASTTGGRPLPADTRAQMGAAFGHDFAHVRVFHDDKSAEAAQALGAQAYTVGADIFFNANAFNPGDSHGRALLAHELTHVVQQDRHGAPGGGPGGISAPGDAAEREASALAGRAAAGQPVQVRQAPSAAASRGLFSWAEDKISGAASAVADTAGAAWQGTKGAVGAVGHGIADTASDIYGGMKTAGGWVKSGEEAIGHGIDWVEDKEKQGTSWVADKAKGIPVLEQVASAGKSLVDTQTELVGGVGRGVTGLVGGVAGMVANPVDTARGLEAMAEHIPGPAGTMLKGAHGLLNVATGDETWGQLGQSLTPGQSLHDDGQFWKTVGGGLVGQYSEQWKEGKYADVVGHAGFDIGSLFLGAGEAGAAAKLGDASKLADAADLGKAADAARLGETADAGKLADVAKTPEQNLIEQMQQKHAELDARAALDPRDPAFLSKNKRGPVLSGIVDTADESGQVHFGLNDFKQQPPADLHPMLQERLETQQGVQAARKAEIEAKQVAGEALSAEDKSVLTAGSPGYHSEVYSLDAALKARELRTGVPVGPEDLSDFLLHNISLKGERAGGVPPRCFNCDPITEGVSLTGPLRDTEHAFHGLPPAPIPRAPIPPAPALPPLGPLSGVSQLLGVEHEGERP